MLKRTEQPPLCGKAIKGEESEPGDLPDKIDVMGDGKAHGIYSVGFFNCF